MLSIPSKLVQPNIFFDKLTTLQTLMLKFYITNKDPSITKQVEIVDLKKLIIATMDMDNETFIVYITIKK